MNKLFSFIKKFDEYSFENIFENSIFPIIITDANWREGLKIIYVNRAFCNSTGYMQDELIGKNPNILQGEDSNYKVIKELKTELLKGNSFSGQSINYRKDGSSYYVHWSINPIQNKDKTIGYISYQKMIDTIQKRKYKELLNSVLETSENIIMITDLDGFIIYVNDAFTEKLGYDKNELIGKHSRVLKSGKQSLAFYKNMWNELLLNGVFSDVFISKKKDGTLFSEKKNIRTLKDESQNPIYYLSSGEDITSKIEKEKNLYEAIYKDSLTGIYNRKKYDEIIDDMILLYEMKNHIFSLILLDIDFFKDINDTYGHDIGDYILVELSKVLVNNTRNSDILFRWGGEEFIVIIKSGVNESYNLAEKLRNFISKSKFQSIKITASFGVAQMEKNLTKKDLFTNVDKALYEAKNAGRNKVVIYNKSN